jgi:ribosomal protein S8
LWGNGFQRREIMHAEDFAKNIIKLNSKTNREITNVGYIKDYSLYSEENKQLIIKVFLNYKGWWIKKPLFSILKRISKPGHRIFSGYKKFDNVIDVLRYEQGIAIVSTSIGVMSHNKATTLKKGGIWVNFGPLLFHYKEMLGEVSIEVSWETLRLYISKCF